MKLWHISQSVNNSYDTYDSAVVAAETELLARRTYPTSDSDDAPTPFDEERGQWYYIDYKGNKIYSRFGDTWARRYQDVSAKYIGEAVEGTSAGVICASFNAG